MRVIFQAPRLGVWGAVERERNANSGRQWRLMA